MSQGHTAEKLSKNFVDLLDRNFGQARSLQVTVLILLCVGLAATERQVHRAFNGVDQLLQRDVLRIPGQPIAARRTTHRAHQPAGNQFFEDIHEHGQRHQAAFGKLTGADLLGRQPGQLHKPHQRIVCFSTQRQHDGKTSNKFNMLIERI